MLHITHCQGATPLVYTGETAVSGLTASHEQIHMVTYGQHDQQNLLS